MYDDLSVEQLKARLSEAQSLVKALRKNEIDAVVGENSVAVLRLHEMEQKLHARTNELQSQNEDLAEARNALASRAEELERVNSELEAFSYAVSHDLRNPLNNILTFVELLADEIPKEEKGDDARLYLHYIEEASHRLNELLENTLKLIF